MTRSLLAAPIDAARRVDRTLGQWSGRRRVLVDARTPVNYTMVAPIHRAMAADPRVSFYFTASEEPERLHDIYREALSARSARPGQAPELRLIAPSAAWRMRFDAYIASDYVWQPLPRGTCRIQIFHGVAGKYGFDAPTESLRAWDRLFFINRRRMRNVIAAGALDADSKAIRLVGMPKADCLVDGTFQRDAVLEGLDLDPTLPTVLYAPTRSPESSLNAMGLDLVRGFQARPLNLIVKLHDRQRDLRHAYSGGVDWIEALRPLLGPRTALAPAADISPYLVAADLMITDHSSAGFEFLLQDRPLVRIHRPELLRGANIHPDYVSLLASASESVLTADDALAAVDRGLADPATRSAARRAVAAELFYRPGSATARSVAELYEALSLEPLASETEARREVTWQSSL
jgi:CDP-glycerol:poly(glycerophosphate) glycerophosphotransferase